MGIRNAVVGDRVVYSKDKVSVAPGPRATEVSPAPKGDEYSYLVDKYWVVKEVRDDGSLCLLTRRGKEHIIPADDVRLRRPNLWERLTKASRFPALPKQS